MYPILEYYIFICFINPIIFFIIIIFKTKFLLTDNLYLKSNANFIVETIKTIVVNDDIDQLISFLITQMILNYIQK